MPIVQHLGATVTAVEYGVVEVQMPYRHELSFRSDGAIQAGAIGALIDFAGGAAVVSTLPSGASATTLDYSIKMLAPPVADTLVATARVPQPKRSIHVCLVDVVARTGNQDVLCAVGTVTMLTARDR